VSVARRSSLLLCGVVDFGDWACPEGFFEALLGRPWLSVAFSFTCCLYVGFRGVVGIAIDVMGRVRRYDAGHPRRIRGAAGRKLENWCQATVIRYKKERHKTISSYHEGNISSD